MTSHENTTTTVFGWAFTPQTSDFAVFVNLVVLGDGHLDLLALVLDLLWCVVGLSLLLLGTTSQTQHQVKGRLGLNTAVSQSLTVFQLTTGKDQALFINGNVLDLGLDGFDRISSLDI
eukprot:Lithocolla_globosa_v1_NODE_9977_length_648_cov_90.853288.p2 type:complete len:118 gc:universal NODE_9977_length_648_cov_90.853288:185-538(+)